MTEAELELKIETARYNKDTLYCRWKSAEMGSALCKDPEYWKKLYLEEKERLNGLVKSRTEGD